MVCIGLCVVLAIRGVIAGEALPEVVLVFVTFGWFSAGIYLVREYLWIGIALAAGLLGLLFIEGFGWTGVGLLSAASLALAGWRGGRKSVSET